MITVIVIHYRLFFIWFTSGKSLLLVTGSTQDKLLMIFHTFKTIEISEKSLTQSYWVENSCYRRLVIARGNQVLRSLNLNLAIWINLQWYANMVLYWQTNCKSFYVSIFGVPLYAAHVKLKFHKPFNRGSKFLTQKPPSSIFNLLATFGDYSKFLMSDNLVCIWYAAYLIIF